MRKAIWRLTRWSLVNSEMKMGVSNMAGKQMHELSVSVFFILSILDAKTQPPGIGRNGSSCEKLKRLKRVTVDSFCF